MRHSTKSLLDGQDYRPRAIPTLAEINALDDDAFSAYLRRGCRPEPSDLLYLLDCIEQLEARILAIEQERRDTPKPFDPKEQTPIGPVSVGEL